MSVLIHEQSGRRTIYYPDDRHRTLISIQPWSDPASAENAFRHGLVTWKIDEDPPEAPVVLKEIVHPDNRLRAREPSEANAFIELISLECRLPYVAQRSCQRHHKFAAAGPHLRHCLQHRYTLIAGGDRFNGAGRLAGIAVGF